MPLSPEMMAFAAANPVAFVATVEGTKPRVRAFNMWKVDGSGFYFHNNKKEDLYQQLKTNKNIELLFAPTGGAGAALRVEGQVEFVDDPAVAAAFYGTPGKEKFMGKKKAGIDPVIFRIPHGEAWFRPAPEKHVPKPAKLPTWTAF